MTTKKEMIRADKNGNVEVRCACGSSEVESLYNALDWVAKALYAHSLFLKCLKCGEKFSAHPECTQEPTCRRNGECRWCRDLEGPA